MKRIFAILFPIPPNSSASLLALLLFSSASLKAELLYETSPQNTITITGSNPQPSGFLLIPSTINNLPVTAIGYAAFSGCTGLTSVTLPSSITDIGWSAFSGCTGLTSVTLPSSITKIGNDAFIGCTGLKAITVDIANSTYSSNDGILFNKAQTSLIAFPAGKIGAYSIPNSVTSIGKAAFEGCTGLTSVTLPSSITEIGDGTFYGCTGLTSVTLPSSITKIYDGVFSGCTGLTSVTLPSSITEIGDGAFEGCTGLTSVTLPSSITDIGYGAFAGCTGLTSVTLPSSITKIGNGMFSGCTGLTSVTLPSSITKIGSGMFSGCTGLTSVTLPSSITEIGYGTFSGCTGLTSVTLPSSITAIGAWAFEGCTGLTSVTLPSSITAIGAWAFKGCTGLTSVYFMGNAPSVNGVWMHTGGVIDKLILVTKVFSDANKATVYYIQGKTGWSSSFAGRPTATFIPTLTPVITSAIIATATVGQPFIYNITADNGPTSFAATGLPTGLSINSVTGVISGTTTTVGSSSITINASNVTGTGNQTLLLTVSLPPMILIINYNVTRNVFELMIKDEVAQEHAIEYTENFQSWTALPTKVVGIMDLTLIDPQATNKTHRFYRVIKQ